MRRKRQNNSPNGPELPQKANRLLNGILIAFVLIGLRIWHLAVVEYEERTEAAAKPKIREMILPAKRGTIRDRFNQPLAINQVQYHAAILYSQIRQIPNIGWKTNDQGKKSKYNKRLAYIAELSELLSKELHLDAERVEDLIHSKGALYQQLPFIIQEDITESQYYRLKALERDWVGICMQRVPKRVYPKGRLASDVIGYMGAISREEYESIIQEIKTLRIFFDEWEEGGTPLLPQEYASVDAAYNRLQELQEHAYTINDYIGKMGVEASFEEELRGFHGKRRFYSDARGNFLRELEDGYEPQSGQRLLLTISAELQEYAEKLLIQNETNRSARVNATEISRLEELSQIRPWIKGGAIVVMDPNQGDLLALASNPRYDPNDFISSAHPQLRESQRERVNRWFETKQYLGNIWDQIKPLEKELIDLESGEYIEKALWLNWSNYLDSVLPPRCAVRTALEKISHMQQALQACQEVDKLLLLCGERDVYTLFNQIWTEQPYRRSVRAAIYEEIEERIAQHPNEILLIKKNLEPIFADLPANYDKILFLDLLRLIVDSRNISVSLEKQLKKQSLTFHREASVAFAEIEPIVCEMAKDLFHELLFKPWRQNHQQLFLKQKRQEEKALGRRYAKPYIDLLDREEKRQFNQFWNSCRWDLLLCLLTGKGQEDPFFTYFKTWHRELFQGAHRALPWRSSHKLLQKAIAGLSFSQALDYLRSLRKFSDLDRPLLGRYRHLRHASKGQTEADLAMGFYPVYGYGSARSYAFRQTTTQGSLFKLIIAYQALVQRYQDIDDSSASYANLNPMTMIDQIYRKGGTLYMGYTADGKPIPQFYKGGRLIRSARANLGWVDLYRALEVSSNPYFSLLAGDYLKEPEDLLTAAKKFSYGAKTGIDLPAEIGGRLPDDLSYNRNGLYATAVGQHSLDVTPLQTAVMLSAIANGGKVIKPKIVLLKAGSSKLKPSASSQEKKLTILRTATELQRQIFFPDIIRKILLNGMQKVVAHTFQASLSILKEHYGSQSTIIKDFISLKEEIVGKSGTAESVECLSLDQKLGAALFNHLWFGGIIFDKNNTFVINDIYGRPELVVVVYLRFGEWGKDLAPIATSMAKKWREIKARHQ